MAYTDQGYLLTQGRVFLAERAFNGALLTGLQHIGDADAVQLNIAQKTQQIKASYAGQGETLDTPVTETECTIKINALDSRLTTWAVATWGASSGAVAGGTASGESIKLFNGQYTKLSRIGVASVTVTGATQGLDYIVDSPAHGLLYVLPTSPAIPVGAPLTTVVAYTYAANNGKVESFVLGQKVYQIVVAGRNSMQGGQPTLMTIRQTKLQMARTIDAISKKHTQLELSGEVIFDSSIARATTAGDFSNYFSLEKA